MRMTKDFASLSPSILARKGGARPAMRSQLQPFQSYAGPVTAPIEDDLGWNDMGHDAKHTPHQPVQLAPVESVAPVEEIVPVPPVAIVAPVAEPVPEVVRQRAVIAEKLGVEQVDVEPEAAPPVQRRSALSAGRRAAFTLRLDADRHLNLRLASTILNKSAQSLVTEALDRFLAEMPEVGALAGTIRKRG